MPSHERMHLDGKKSVLLQSSFLAETNAKKRVFRTAFETSEHDFVQIIVQVRDVPFLIYNRDGGDSHLSAFLSSGRQAVFFGGIRCSHLNASSIF